jgi:hypothetical protein
MKFICSYIDIHMSNKPPYLLGRVCEGNANGKDPSYFRLDELRALCSDLGLPTKGTKNEVCHQIRQYLTQNPNQINRVESKYGFSKIKITAMTPQSPHPVPPPLPPRQAPQRQQPISVVDYADLEAMMKDFGIVNYRDLIDLTDDELEALIGVIKLHENTVRLSDLVKGKNLEAKSRILVDEMAGKLCRCVEKVHGATSPVAACIASIFHGKGITTSRHQCRPVPVLIPRKGNKAVILKRTRPF